MVSVSISINGTRNPVQGLGLQKKISTYGAFTLHVKSVLNENLGGILGGTQC
jgi:hypothetical protein